MSTVPNAQYDDLEKLINDSLQKACAHKDRLRRTGTRCTITNIIFSALATFVAGSAVIFPALVGTNWNHLRGGRRLRPQRDHRRRSPEATR